MPEQEPVNIEIIDVSNYQPPRMLSKKWRECINKIYEVDPLCCPNCGGEMKIISFIDEFLIIKQILEHPGLWVQKPSRDPPGRNSSDGNNDLTYSPSEIKQTGIAKLLFHRVTHFMMICLPLTFVCQGTGYEESCIMVD